jgi:putative flippase GtrA
MTEREVRWVMRVPSSTLGRMARFAAMGAAGFGLNIAITVSLHEGLGASEELAFAVALTAVFVFSFLTSRHLIFSGASRGDPKRQLIRFALSNAGFRVAEYVGFLVLHTLLRLPYLLAIVGVLGCSFLTKFITYSTVVFVDDREVS